MLSTVTGYCTPSVTVAVCNTLPEAPVTVSVLVPVGAFFVLMIRVELPVMPAGIVTGFGLNLALANLGRPLMLRLTLPPKLFSEPTLIV